MLNFPDHFVAAGATGAKRSPIGAHNLEQIALRVSGAQQKAIGDECTALEVSIGLENASVGVASLPAHAIVARLKVLLELAVLAIIFKATAIDSGILIGELQKSFGHMLLAGEHVLAADAGLIEHQVGSEVGFSARERDKEVLQCLTSLRGAELVPTWTKADAKAAGFGELGREVAIDEFANLGLLDTCRFGVVGLCMRGRRTS